MASLTFSSGTVIPSTWLNDVNTLTWGVFNGATTPALARTALSLGSAALLSSSAILQTSNNLSELTATASTARNNISAAANGAITASGLTVSTGKLLGRTTAATGAIEEITVSTGLSLSGTTLTSALSNYLTGLVLSTAGSSSTMSIASGVATDSSNTITMSLGSSISKTTSAWAVGTGNGGIDTGSIANNTWYHFYLIRRPDTGVVDVVFSTNASTPTLPTNYTQYRRIGSGRTNGSAQWIKFIQNGDDFTWDVPVADVTANNPGTTAVTRVLTVPTGVKVEAKLRVTVQVNAASAQTSSALLLSDLAITDTAPSTVTGFDAIAVKQTNDSYASSDVRVITDTSASIRSRVSASDAQTAFYIATSGWIDRRGRD